MVALAGIPAAASTLTYSFTAEHAFGTAADDTVDTIADVAESLIGTTLTGTITLDDTFLSGDAVGRVYAAPSITIDQMDLSGVLPFSSTILQNGETGFDAYSLVTDLPATSGDVVSQIYAALRDTDGTILGNTGFPPLPALSEFEFTVLAFIGNVTGEVNARERVDYRFTSLTRLPDNPVVPLPAGLPLLLAGIGAFALVRRRA